jgi:hypothetical protein
LQQRQWWKLELGDKERHDGAIRCAEVRRAIHEVTTSGNLNLREEVVRRWAQRRITPQTLIFVELLAGIMKVGVLEAAVDAPLAVVAGAGLPY